MLVYRINRVTEVIEAGELPDEKADVWIRLGEGLTRLLPVSGASRLFAEDGHGYRERRNAR